MAIPLLPVLLSSLGAAMLAESARRRDDRYGAVASWMGGRGPSAGTGVAGWMGGRTRTTPWGLHALPDLDVGDYPSLRESYPHGHVEGMQEDSYALPGAGAGAGFVEDPYAMGDPYAIEEAYVWPGDGSGPGAGFGAVASWMGGRGPSAGTGVAGWMGGRIHTTPWALHALPDLDVADFPAVRDVSPYEVYESYGVVPAVAAAAVPVVAVGATVLGGTLITTWMINAAVGRDTAWRDLALAGAGAAALPADLFSPDSEAWKVEGKAVSAILASANVRIDPDCLWVLSPHMMLMKLAQILERRLADVRMAGTAQAEINKAVAAALQRFSKLSAEKNASRIAKALGSGRATFTSMMLNELMMLVGFFLLELGGLVPYVAEAIDELVRAMESCLDSMKKSLPGVIWSQLRKFGRFAGMALRHLPRAIALRGGVTLTLVTSAALLGAFFDEIAYKHGDKELLDALMSLEFWRDLLAGAQMAQAVRRGEIVHWNASGVGQAYLERPDAPGLHLREGPVPAGTYRVFVQEGGDAPVQQLDELVQIKLPEQSKVEQGRLLPWSYHLSCSDGSCGWKLLLHDGSSGAVVRSTDMRLGQDDEGVKVWQSSGARPASPQAIPDATAPARQHTPSQPSGRGTSTWSMGSGARSAYLESQSETRYEPGEVPAGTYELYISPAPGFSHVRVGDVTLAAGRTYALSCDTRGCSMTPR